MRPDDWRRYEGQVINERYHLRQLIGSGSFGGVFAADEVVAERSIARVAIKLIEPQSDDFGAEIAELAALRGMNHPHLARGLAVGQCTCLGRDLLFVVMDLADDTLLSRLRHSTLSQEETLELAAHVADGLAYLHANRIVHRDLKPANLLRTGSIWQLADFGLVRTLAADGSALLTRSDPSGTFPYMPPDAFRGEISPAWDLWSLGILLVEALTGQRPFNDATLAEYVYAILHKEPQIPEGLPEPLSSIIRGCLVQDRASRWTADQIKQAAFASLAARFGSGGTPSYASFARGSGGTAPPPPVFNVPSPRSKDRDDPAAGSGESPTRLSSSPQPQEPLVAVVEPIPVPAPFPPPDPIPGPPPPVPPRRGSSPTGAIIGAVVAAALLVPATLFALSRSRGSHPTPTPHPTRRAATPNVRPTSAPHPTKIATKTPTPRPTPDAAALALARRRRAQFASQQEQQARAESAARQRREQKAADARAQRAAAAAQARRDQRRREQKAASTRPTAPRVRFCPICGEHLAPGQHFCSKTGQRI